MHVQLETPFITLTYVRTANRHYIKEKMKRPQSTKAPPSTAPAPPKPKTKNDSYKQKVNEWLRSSVDETSKTTMKQAPVEKSIMKKPTELKITPTEPVINPPLHVNFASTTDSKNIQKNDIKIPMVVEVPMIVPGARKPQSPPPIQTNPLEASPSETRTEQVTETTPKSLIIIRRTCS